MISKNLASHVVYQHRIRMLRKFQIIYLYYIHRDKNKMVGKFWNIYHGAQNMTRAVSMASKELSKSESPRSTDSSARPTAKAEARSNSPQKTFAILFDVKCEKKSPRKVLKRLCLFLLNAPNEMNRLKCEVGKTLTVSSSSSVRVKPVGAYGCRAAVWSRLIGCRR